MYTVRKAGPLLFVTSTEVLRLKYTGLKGRRYLHVRLFSVLFYWVIAVHKFDFRLLIKETPIK